MQKYNIRKKEAGFSLLEMMIAVAIIVIVAASLVPLMTFVNQSGHSNQNRMMANNLAASIMEEIRAMDYEAIGTIGGNPSGTLPQLQSVNYNGADYEVETLISWGAAKGKNTEINPVAYLNARVIVRGLNTFTGISEELAELHTVITRDGEEPLIENGHLRAQVLDSEEQPIGDPSVNVEIIAPISQHLMTDYNGTAIFGILDEGNYSVRAKVEEGLFASPTEIVTDGWIERNNIEVEDNAISDVKFYMDKKSKACQLEIKLIDAETKNVILERGKVSLYVELDNEAYIVYHEKEFTTASFAGGCLPSVFSGSLWPEGTYNIVISDVPEYKDYNLLVEQSAFITDESDLWNGEFDSPGTTLTVTIPMKIIYFYEENSKDDFEDNTEMEDLIATDFDTLELDSSSDIVDRESITNLASSSESGNKGPENLFDGDKKQSSSWDTGVSPNTQPQWIGCEFERNIAITGIEVYLSHNENNPGANPNHKPKDFYIRVSSDGVNWEEIYTGTFPVDKYSYLININPPKTCRYFELWITSEYESNQQGIRIYEIEIFTESHRFDSGKRLSKPISLAQHDSSKNLSIEWDVFLPERTTFEVWTIVTNGTNPIPEEGFIKVENGDLVPDIGYLENLENKYLWILQKFTTEDVSVSPVLNWLRLKEKGPGE
jgi:prepilin-type N-terminal cleavage/methylation domain-containing protein